MSDGSSPDLVYTNHLLASLERTVSRDRLRRYLAPARQDMKVALRLYEANVAVSEALYGVLHGVKIAVRNAMHHDLTAGYNSTFWYNSAPLTKYLTAKVNEAKYKAGGAQPPPGKVVAELSFGFWADLTAQRNHWPFWVPHIHKAFPNASAPHPLRSNVHARLEKIRSLRNRIAHHEPILTSQNRVYAGHQSYLELAHIDECVNWVCIDTAQWLNARSRFHLAVEILAQVRSTGVTI